MVVNARPVDVDRIEEVELRRFGLVSVSQDSSIGHVGWERIFRPKDGVLVGTILVQDPQPRLRGS
jgi:alkyl hydroperoxide reductase subunit AhpC